MKRKHILGSVSASRMWGDRMRISLIWAATMLGSLAAGTMADAQATVVTLTGMQDRSYGTYPLGTPVNVSLGYNPALPLLFTNGATSGAWDGGAASTVSIGSSIYTFDHLQIAEDKFPPSPSGQNVVNVFGSNTAIPGVQWRLTLDPSAQSLVTFSSPPQTGSLSSFSAHSFDLTSGSSVQAVSDNLALNVGAPAQAYSTTLGAAVGEWSTFINDALHSEAQSKANAVINCGDSSSCNFDTVGAERQAYETNALRDATAAATSSEDYVNETGVPTTISDTAQFIISHGKDIVNALILLKDNLLGVAPTSDTAVAITGSTNRSALLASSNFNGTYYSETLTAQFNASELINLQTGDSFLTQFKLGDGNIAYGKATITSLVDPPELGTMTLSLQGIEVSGVPEPSSWAMMIIGVGAIGLMMRRQNRESSSNRKTGSFTISSDELPSE